MNRFFTILRNFFMRFMRLFSPSRTRDQSTKPQKEARLQPNVPLTQKLPGTTNQDTPSNTHQKIFGYVPYNPVIPVEQLIANFKKATDNRARYEILRHIIMQFFPKEPNIVALLQEELFCNQKPLYEEAWKVFVDKYSDTLDCSAEQLGNLMIYAGEEPIELPSSTQSSIKSR